MTSSIVLGRKFCSGCGCWRPVSDFSPWRDKRFGGKIRLQSRCRACERERARIRIGIRERGRPYEPTTGIPYGASRWTHCLAGHPLNGPDAEIFYDSRGYRRCRICRREWDRFHAEKRRRANGAPERPRTRRSPRAKGETWLVPIEPFLELVRERLRAGRSLDEIGESFGINVRLLNGYLRGEYRQIQLDTIDRALTVEGSRSLCELYPELYEEGENG